MPNYTQKGRPFRVYTPLGDDVLLLESLDGEESVSRPFRYRLQLLSTNDSISPDDLISKPVHVEIDLADGSVRYIHGLVSNFVQRGRRHIFTGYTAILRPWYWFLSLTQDCFINQNLKVPDIVEDVFTSQGYNDFSVNTYHSYDPREYCVQYRETDLNYASRLLEEEGIFYYFEHSHDKHKLILTDDKSGYNPCPGQSSVNYSPEAASYLEQDVITEFEREVRAASGKASLTDYNFETPNTSLMTSTGDSKQEIYDYPGKYDNKSEGETYVDLRLEELEAPVTVVRGVGNCRALAAGYKFDLKNHYNRSWNTSYFLTRVSVFMETNAYMAADGKGTEDFSNTFEAIPAAVTYRPQRVTPKPVISGVQTAVVVGPSGEEIYVDKYSRVKVQFFWDRFGKKNENSSCWVRVSQDWAGKNWGSIFIPRIGQEVIVDFLEGDPDRPIITGRVYNADQMPPYSLPANMTQSGIKTRSSKGGGGSNFNEFRFEDKMGSELVLLHAEKDLTTEVENDESRKVGNDRTTTISNNETKLVDKGNETITLNQGNQSTTIKMGDQSTSIKMGNQSVELNMGNRSIKVDLGQISEEAMQSIELKVGPSSIKIDPMSITLQAMMIKIQGEIQVQVQGVMVQVNGDAMVQIQGGITMIN